MLNKSVSEAFFLLLLAVLVGSLLSIIDPLRHRSEERSMEYSMLFPASIVSVSIILRWEEKETLGRRDV